MAKDRIGFIGLGIMGKPMVRNLLAAGYEVHVSSLVAADVDAVAKDGAIAETDNPAVAAAADVIITMVPDTTNVEAILFGEGGIAEALAGKVLIDMSTISALRTREFAARLRELGAEVLDAPVSGGDKGAKAGTLSIMVGGDAATVARCMPIFDVLGGRVRHVGGNGAGQVVKSCNQILAASTMAALGEALVLGSKAGVEPDKILDVLGAGYARCGCIDIRGESLMKRDFAPGFMTRLQYKDLNLALELARGVQAPIGIAAQVTELYKACMAADLGDEDHSNVIRMIERLADFEVPAASVQTG